MARRRLALRTLAGLLVFVSSASMLLGACQPADPIAEVREFHRAGRHADSLEPLRRLLAEQPNDAEVHYLYGVALLQTQQPSLAIWSFREAMLDPEWLVPAGLQLAAGALLTGNHDAALEALDRVLDAEPDSVNGRLLRARARVDSKLDYQGALADADRALELDPEAIEAHAARSVALIALDRIDEAEESLVVLEHSYDDADLAGGTVARFCVARAMFAREGEKLEAAAELYEACLEQHPTSYLVIQESIEFYDERRNFDRPLAILRAALEREPAAFNYRIGLAERLRAMGDESAAEQLLREGTESGDPTASVACWMALADDYLQQEEFAAASDALGEAVAGAGEPTPELAFAHADALVMAGRYDRALAAADRLVVPAQRELIYGRTRLAQGQPREALERLTAGLALWPNNSAAHYYAALAAEGIGDFDRAIAEYRYAMRSETDATDARLRLTRLHEAEGEHSLALAAAGHRARGGAPLDFDTRLAGLRASAHLGRLGQWRQYFGEYVGRPGPWAHVVAAAAEGVRERRGASASAELIRSAERLDLADPRNAIALRALVLDLVATGEAEAADQHVSAALAAAPRDASLNAIRALVLERRGAPRREIESAYRQVLEIDPQNVEAYLGLGDIAADAEAARVQYSLALELDPVNANALLAMSDALVELGRSEEAAAALEGVLADNPYDAGAARRLCELMLSQGTAADQDRLLDLAERVHRFGDDPPEAAELLQRVRNLQENSELAARAANRMRGANSATRH